MYRAELQRPLPMPVAGGLTSGTMVSLYLVPVLYVFLKNGI